MGTNYFTPAVQPTDDYISESNNVMIGKVLLLKPAFNYFLATWGKKKPDSSANSLLVSLRSTPLMFLYHHFYCKILQTNKDFFYNYSSPFLIHILHSVIVSVSF